MAELKDKSWTDVVHREGPQGEGAGGMQGPRAARGLREAPPEYFLPRHSARYTATKYGLLLAAGIGAGVATGHWIQQRIAEDGGYIIKGGKKGS